MYVERAAKASGKQSWTNDVGMFARVCDYRTIDGRRLGEWPLGSITEDTLEAFFGSLSAFAASTRNQYVQLLKASFRWAAKKGYLFRSPLSDDSALKRTKVAQRRRRLPLEEEKALLEAAGALTRGAGPRLQWLIIAAIETGCRRGELLAMQWADVNLSKTDTPCPGNGGWREKNAPIAVAAGVVPFGWRAGNCRATVILTPSRH